MQYSRPIRKKWFRHVGTLFIVKKPCGEIRIKGPHSPEYSAMSDRNVQDVFIWLGRYLAMKGKLPRHIKLEEIAVGSSRTTQAIRSVVANEIFETLSKDEI